MLTASKNFMINMHKRTILLVLLTFFILLLNPCVKAEAQVPEDVKIGLFYASSAKDYYTVTAQGGISVSLTNDTDTKHIFSDSAISTVTVKKNLYYSTEQADVFPDADTAFSKVAELRAQGFDAYCALSDTNYTVRIGTYASFEEAQAAAPSFEAYAIHYTPTGVLILDGDVIKIAVDDTDSCTQIAPLGGNISLNSTPYRGAMRFVRSSGNDMAAVNVLPLEEYLYSVVPKEVSASWNEEVLKAQAVAARTYTVTNLKKYSKYGFNLDNTTASQVYGGINAEHPRTTAAVDATKGEIVIYNGSPASIYYHASSGGRTANSEDVWSSALPYLRSVEDPYENPDEATHGKWSVTFTKDEIKKIFADKDINIGDIVNITAKYSGGHATELTFIGTSGSKTYTKDNIRASLSLKSTNFVLTAGGGKSSAVFPAEYTDSQKNTFGYINSTISVYITDLIEKTNVSSAPSPISATEYTFTGGGWGHGVGMSQWGAKGMADNGFNYKEILTHYFTGVQVEKY